MNENYYQVFFWISCETQNVCHTNKRILIHTNHIFAMLNGHIISYHIRQYRCSQFFQSYSEREQRDKVIA